MTKLEFIKFYKKRNRMQNKKEARERIELFWDTLEKVLAEHKKVIFKDWGIFEIKKSKSRRVIIPMKDIDKYTNPTENLKFKGGKKLLERINVRGEKIE